MKRIVQALEDANRAGAGEPRLCAWPPWWSFPAPDAPG